MDAQRLALVIRAIRIRKRWRQADLARAAGVSRGTVARAESPRLSGLQLALIGRIAAALDIRLDFSPRWRGGELDRVMNAGHSAMQEQVASLLAETGGWVFESEVTYAIYGERGSIDLLAFHPERRSLLVVELKTEIVDVGALLAQVDRYLRLAARIAGERGWQPVTTSAWLAVRDSSTNRRRAAVHRSMLRRAFPTDGRALRRWLSQPRGGIRALSFLPPAPAHPRIVRRVRGPPGRYIARHAWPRP